MAKTLWEYFRNEPTRQKMAGELTELAQTFEDIEEHPSAYPWELFAGDERRIAKLLRDAAAMLTDKASETRANPRRERGDR